MLPEIYTVLEEKSDDQGATVQVLELKNMRGATDPRLSSMIYFAEQTGVTIKMIRILLNNSSVRVEPGALYFMKGNLELQTNTGGGIMKGLGRKLLSGENMFINEIVGTGEVYLEPTFGHFLLVDTGQYSEGLIADQGMFFSGSKGMDISAVRNKRLSAMVAGGEGWFQTKILGTGIAALFAQVPAAEIQEFELTGDKLSVDGNFALMRTGGVDFKVEKSSKSWIGTSVSGEGLLQTFTGHGKVWIAPTQGIYDLMTTGHGLSQLVREPGSRHMKTK